MVKIIKMHMCTYACVYMRIDKIKIVIYTKIDILEGVGVGACEQNGNNKPTLSSPMQHMSKVTGVKITPM